MIRRFSVFCFFFFAWTIGYSQLRVPGIISDNMILQQKNKNSIWGWAAAKTEVKVSFAGQTKTAKVEGNGKWTVYLDELPASEQGRDMEIRAGNEIITVKNILVGEVWVCSGQSNMNRVVKEMVKRKSDKNAEIREVASDIEFAMNQSDPLLRRFTVKKVATISGEEIVAKGESGTENGWVESNLKNNEDWSGTAFFFARELRKQLNVPVGVICAAWGGTRIEAWMPEMAFVESERLSELLKRQRTILDAGLKKNTPEGMKAFKRNLETYKQKVEEYKTAGQKPPASLRPPVNPATLKDLPSNFTSLFNGMISPIIPYGIKGVTWYQGESNGSKIANEEIYSELMESMIYSWRRLWKQGDFPFYFVQISNFNFAKDANATQNFEPVALLRQQQLLAMKKIKNTGMIVTIDIGEANDIHPVNKIDVGNRLAYWALAKNYGKTISFSGPVYEQFKIKSNEISLQFSHTGKGLMVGSKKGAKPVKEINDAELKYFQIAGKDKKWYPAQAKIISGNEIRVRSEHVANPVAVRYAWYANPEGPNLYNKDGLPASPFRTDNWEIYE